MGLDHDLLAEEEAGEEEEKDVENANNAKDKGNTNPPLS